MRTPGADTGLGRRSQHVQLVGPFSSGKTTVFDRLSVDGVVKLPEMARMLLEGNPYFMGSIDACKKSGRYEEFQWRVAMLHIMNERAYIDDPAVIDSGTICAYSYAKYCQEPTRDMIRARIAALLDVHPPKKAIFFDPLPIKDDGLRQTSFDDQMDIAQEILKTCRKFGIAVSRIREMPIEPRLHEVQKAINQ